MSRNITLDDSSFEIYYRPERPANAWTHETIDGAADLYNHTQSWSSHAEASFEFTFDGIGFGLCMGSKSDRGTFDVVIDGSEAGSGSQYSSNKDSEPPCDLLFETYELESGPHYVNVHQRQTDGSFLALDYVIVTDALPSDATATTSSEIIPPATLSSTPSSLTSQEPDHPPKNATSAIIAGTALCGLTLTILILIWWCTSMSKRKKQRQRAAAERANMEAAAEEGGHPHQKQDLPMKQSNGLGYTALVDRRKEDSLPIRTVRKARSGFVEYLNFKVSSIPMPHMPYFASSTSSSSEEWVDIEGKASGWAKSIPMPSAPQAMSHVTMPSAGDLRRSEPETTSVEAPVEGEHQTLLPKRRVTFV